VTTLLPHHHHNIYWIGEKLSKTKHISSHDIRKELNIDHTTVLNHLEKVGYKKNSMLDDT